LFGGVGDLNKVILSTLDTAWCTSNDVSTAITPHIYGQNAHWKIGTQEYLSRKIGPCIIGPRKKMSADNIDHFEN